MKKNKELKKLTNVLSFVKILAKDLDDALELAKSQWHCEKCSGVALSITYDSFVVFGTNLGSLVSIKTRLTQPAFGGMGTYVLAPQVLPPLKDFLRVLPEDALVHLAFGEGDEGEELGDNGRSMVLQFSVQGAVGLECVVISKDLKLGEKTGMVTAKNELRLPPVSTGITVRRESLQRAFVSCILKDTPFVRVTQGEGAKSIELLTYTRDGDEGREATLTEISVDQWYNGDRFPEEGVIFNTVEILFSLSLVKSTYVNIGFTEDRGSYEVNTWGSSPNSIVKACGLLEKVSAYRGVKPRREKSEKSADLVQNLKDMLEKVVKDAFGADASVEAPEGFPDGMKFHQAD